MKVKSQAVVQKCSVKKASNFIIIETLMHFGKVLKTRFLQSTPDGCFLTALSTTNKHWKGLWVDFQRNIFVNTSHCVKIAL